MIALCEEPVQRLVLHGIPWSSYDAISRLLERRYLRITFDRGSLEIMTIGLEHEFPKRLLGRFIEMLTFVLHIAIHSGGSTTLRRQLLDRGLEPDECCWIQNERRIRGKRKFDIESDPPPDLAVEIDITSSSLDRMGFDAAMRVPEVWRYDRDGLSVRHLGADGMYRAKRRSRAFPFLPLDEIERFLRQGQTGDETTLLHSFHDWVRDTLLPVYAARLAKGTKVNTKPKNR
jgi:Uma2 family endonuclease